MMSISQDFRQILKMIGLSWAEKSWDLRENPFETGFWYEERRKYEHDDDKPREEVSILYDCRSHISGIDKTREDSSTCKHIALVVKK